MAEETTAPELELAPERAAELISMGGAQAVDVRSADEHAAGHIAEATHVPFERLKSEAGSLEEGRPLIFYCRAGERSASAATAFQASGREAYSIAGGLLAWVERGLPLEPPNGEVAARSGLPPG
jgi:rhodanese-related sulfurtransferase